MLIKNHYKKILLINLGGMGDVLFSKPAIKAINKRYPDARITLLTSYSALEAANLIPQIDKVTAINTRQINITDLGTILSLRRYRFSLAVNMRSITNPQSALKMRLLLKTIKPEKSAGWDTAGMGRFFDIRIPEPLVATKHELQYHIDTANALDAICESAKIDIPVDAAVQEDVLKKYNIFTKNKLIVIHPGGMPSRRWPIKNFIALIDMLQKNYEVKVAITGSYSEKKLAGDIQDSCACDIINTAGALDFMRLCAIINRCDLFIGNDTGPTHIAAILNRPMIAIFGPGQINRYDPRVISANARVLHKPTPCAPCNTYKCLTQDCLRKISIQEVFDAAAEKLNKV